VKVDTPFPERPGTPYWDPRGGPSGIGDVTPLTTGINTALADATAAYIATVNAPPLGPNGQPLVYNPSTGLWTASATVASSSGGLVMLLAIGALIFFMSRGR
jgi:hypothetical protein